MFFVEKLLLFIMKSNSTICIQLSLPPIFFVTNNQLNLFLQLSMRLIPTKTQNVIFQIIVLVFLICVIFSSCNLE